MLNGTHTRMIAGVAVVAGLAHVPFVNAPLRPDEGGFLMVAAQWAPGSSLYGDYWVDRPPLLIAFFAVADHLGGAVALRLLGIVAVLISVLTAGRIGRLMSRPKNQAGVATAATAAVFLAQPLFGTAEVNGEVISVAAILLAIAAGLTAHQAPPSHRSRWLAAAGGLAATAVLVKQNQLDAFVFLAGLVTVTGIHGAAGQRLRGVRRDTAAVIIGAGATTALVLTFAALQGTSPLALWDAMVAFRIDASLVIESSASPATGHRLWGLLGVLALTGAPLLVLQLLGRMRSVPRARSSVGHDLRWVAVAVLAWECVSVIGGGSYWLHYLISLIPGLVLAVGVTAAGSCTLRSPASPSPALVYCTTVATIALIATVARPGPGPTEDPTSSWLAAHATPGDTAVVAYGHPNILEGAGLESPYPYLWSLIVRVKDPDLALLTSRLSGDDRPDWLITGPNGLHGWGIDPTAGDEQLAERYRPVATVGDHVIYLQNDRPLP